MTPAVRTRRLSIVPPPVRRLHVGPDALLAHANLRGASDGLSPGRTYGRFGGPGQRRRPAAQGQGARCLAGCRCTHAGAAASARRIVDALLYVPRMWPTAHRSGRAPTFFARLSQPTFRAPTLYQPCGQFAMRWSGDHDWPRPLLGDRGSSLAGLAEIACDPGGGAGAGQFVGGRHPHLPEEFACTITRGELAVRVVVIRNNVEAHHNGC